MMQTYGVTQDRFSQTTCLSAMTTDVDNFCDKYGGDSPFGSNVLRSSGNCDCGESMRIAGNKSHQFTIEYLKGPSESNSSAQNSHTFYVYVSNESTTSSDNKYLWNTLTTRSNFGEIDLHPIHSMGEHFYNRFVGFRDQYNDGWNFGEGNALSGKSIRRMIYFLRQFDSFPVEPSLFLTFDGFLQIAWEDSDGCEISIDFEDEGYSYFLEAKGIEDHTTSLVEILEAVKA